MFRTAYFSWRLLEQLLQKDSFCLWRIWCFQTKLQTFKYYLVRDQCMLFFMPLSIIIQIPRVQVGQTLPSLGKRTPSTQVELFHSIPTKSPLLLSNAGSIKLFTNGTKRFPQIFHATVNNDFLLNLVTINHIPHLPALARENPLHQQ